MEWQPCPRDQSERPDPASTAYRFESTRQVTAPPLGGRAWLATAPTPIRHSWRMSGRFKILWLSLLAQRLLELHLSRENSKDQSGPAADPRWFPAMILVHVAMFAAPPLEVLRTGSRPRWRLGWEGMVVASNLLRIWSIRSLGRQWNVRGIVAKDYQVVSRGPYRWIRHPNYLAVGLEVFALPMAAGAWRSALVLSAANAVILHRRIRAEEDLLGANPGYASVFASKGRFIPRLRRGPASRE
jgi:methyltransferase